MGKMVECMAQLVQKCLSTSCPTMLDAIPGLRSEYHVVRFFASQVDSMDDLINTIFMIIPFSSEQERDAIRQMIPDPTQFLCMDDNSMDQIGDMLTDAFGQLMQLVGGSLDLNDIMGEQLADQFFCSNDILTQVMQPAMTMLPQLINSQSENDVCNTFVDFANNMIGQIFTHCDFTRVDDFIAPFMPPDFPVEIFSVIEGFVPMLQGLRLPSCPGPYNPCDYNPCMDQGVCQHSGDGSYTCYCFDGSQGQMCPGGMDPCDSYPCMGQGSCISNGQSYYCTGGMDPCDSNPCYGQGSCISNGQSYYCSGFNPCDSNPCNYQGSCVSNGDSYECHCYDGSHGQTCPGYYDPCESNPCNNQGSCVRDPHMEGEYECHCYDGSHGQSCPDENPCDSNPCNNQGSCINNNGSYYCECYSGYYGSNCQEEWDPCACDPCHNGGSCYNNDGSYQCVCYD